MRPLKYTQVYVHSEVYVNSQCDYTFYVSIKSANEIWRGRYDPTTEVFWTEGAEPKFPRYVIDECDRQSAQRLLSSDTVYHEYDRDGNKRYQDLRYYDAEDARRYALHILKSLEKTS